MSNGRSASRSSSRKRVLFRMFRHYLTTSTASPAKVGRLDVPDLRYRDALRQALREEMLRDESIFLIGQDIAGFGGAYKVTEGLFDEFGGRRVRDTPVAEEGAVGLAIGAAMVGLRPVVELMTINFSLIAIDQIINNAAKIHYMFGGQFSVPMEIRTP